jgi:hypothetical protein
MTSVLNVDTIAAKDGTSAVTLTKQHATKMWANVLTGGGSYRDSFNASTLTDYATGRYGVALTNNMSDNNYCTFVGADMTDPGNSGYFYQQCMFDSNNSGSGLMRISNGHRESTDHGYDDVNDIHMGVAGGDLA